MRMVASVALLAVASAVAWVGGEAIARAILGPPAMHYLTPPYRDRQTDFDVHYQVRADGIRAGCAQVLPGAPVVAVIGDSFAFGQGVPQGTDFAARLGCATGLDVRNLGSIGQDFLWYDAALHAYVPADAHAIVLLLYENDLPPPGWDGPVWAAKRTAYRNSHAILMLRKARRNLGAQANADALEAYKIDGRLNNPKTVALSDPGFFASLAQPEPGRLAALGAAVAGFVADARKVAPQAEIVVAMAPEASSLSPGHRAFYQSLAAVPLPDLGRPTAIYEAARSGCAGAPGCRFLDLYPAFAEGQGADYFPHDFHWNPAGHARMAQVLAAELTHHHQSRADAR